MTGVDVSGHRGPSILSGSERKSLTSISDYSFQIAYIEDDQVTQYALGMIQIPVFGGTFYPYGPA